MLTPYPQIVEYNEAVQNPPSAFRDPELCQGRVKVNALGLPLVLSGGFALTYMMATRQRTLALRCFHREIPAAEQKYAAIARTLKALRSPYFVGFDFVPDGIRIRGGFYPVLKMDWADGDPLGVWLDRYSNDRRAIERLRKAFAALAAHLEQHGIAHGDIQNGNVIISSAGLKLVDYDGLYVPGMPVEFGCETGHKHFQHPDRTTAHFGPQVDRFSFIAVDLSLAALIEDPALYRRFRQGGETILFRANDFADPEHSEALRCVASHASLGAAAQNFAAICRAEIAAVPSLADFRAGRNIPSAARRATHVAASPGTSAAAAGPSTARYIGPCPTIEAEDFAAVSRCVGQRVELVGRIRSVRRGGGKDGRRQGQPCIYVDFAAPRGDGVEITVWTEGATSLPDAPDQTWIGRWASIVGLVEPPRVERGFWSNSTRVGISTGTASEIDLISEAEARFRLSLGERAAAPAAGKSRPGAPGGNRHLVSRLLNNGSSAAPPVKAASPAPGRAAAPSAGGWKASRSNQAIVGALRGGFVKPVQPSAPAAARTSAMFVAPRSAAPAAASPPRASIAAAPRQPPRPSMPMPKSGSFVIHPRARRPLPPPPSASAAPPSPWQRVLRFLGIEG